MKHSLFKWGTATLMAGALLVPTLSPAQAVRYTATAWFMQQLAPHIPCVSSHGQVSLKGNVHVAKMLSDEPRCTGKVTAVDLDVSLNPDGSGTFSGMAWMEVGIWTGDNFTRTDGGLWETKMTGLIHADGSFEFKFTGSGIGGSIDGLHVIMTGTRASSLPEAPYLLSGLITAVGHD